MKKILCMVKVKVTHINNLRAYRLKVEGIKPINISERFIESLKPDGAIEFDLEKE